MLIEEHNSDSEQHRYFKNEIGVWFLMTLFLSAPTELQMELTELEEDNIIKNFLIQKETHS